VKPLLFFRLALSVVAVPIILVALYLGGLYCAMLFGGQPQAYGTEKLPLWIHLYPFATDTEFSPDFTFSGLRMVELGDSASKVQELCGAPIRKSEITGTPYEIWRYSISPSSTHYWSVYIKLDIEADAVVEKSSSFYFD